jgi:hypothetical protein
MANGAAADPGSFTGSGWQFKWAAFILSPRSGT